VHADHLSIGLVRESSLTGHIDDQYAPFPSQYVSESRYGLPVDIHGRLIEERLALGLRELVSAVLEDSLSY